MKSSGRILQLDILRIIAVFLVLGRHADSFPADEYGRLVSYLTDTWTRCGWIGVDLFFVLSGFLVSGVLFREYIDRGEIGVKRFFIRRAFKIYPAFYTMILLTIIAAIGQNVHLDRHRVWSELFFVQNYFPALWAHTWSLAVEEHFYLLLPALLVLLSGGHFRQLPVVLAFVACLLLVFRILTVHSSGLAEFNILYKTHLRLDSLCFGVLLSYYFHFKPIHFMPFRFVARHPILVLAFTSAMLVPAVLFTIENSVFMNTLGLSLLYLGFGALLIGVLHWDSVGRFTSTNLGSFLAYLGERSYSIYLWHMPVKEWGVPLLDKVFGTTPHMLAFCFYVVVSVAFGVWMARIVEFPALKVRDYLFPRRINSRVSSADNPPDIGGGRSGQGKAA
jgi:peptidoglycan/LPS O-acetylase OafA/YrhL